MAKASDAGHRVVAVFATEGEAGDAERGQFGAGAALRRHRRAEAEAAADILGVSRVVFLGFADSGSDHRTANPPGSFSLVPVEHAAARLAEVLCEEQADVLTTYDRHGGYGHPDHVQVHRVGARAGVLAGTPAVLEATVSRELLQAGVELAHSMGHDLGEDFRPDSLDAWYLPEAEITTIVDVRHQLDRKRAAMWAHASQATSDAGTVRSLEVFAGLPEDLFALAFAKEWFVRRSPQVAGTDDDLFAGLR
jgi:LmbE family N-acetylglucosaminyl deacetylase